jgi:sugar/nucleoside kinase (ribokinase family)
VLACPIGTDLAGRYLAAMLEADGVRWEGPEKPRTAVTAILPVDGERAMATFDPGDELGAAELLARLEPRAVVIGLPRLRHVPAGAWAYAAVGDLESRLENALDAAELAHARAFLSNEVEACRMTGAATAEEAAAALGEITPVAVVTLGSRGVVACADGELVHAEAPAVDVRDTTGAGDLFASAYVWADLAGAPLPERLRWANLYAGLSVRAPTAHGGAVGLEELEHAGRSLGLAPPSHTSRKETR